MTATEEAPGQRRQRRNLRMLGKLAVVVLLMFGFGYSLVPLYKKICELTGINVLAVQETVNVKPANTQVDTSRTITVEFDANTTGPWRFKPMVSSIQVHPGEGSSGV
jgi:cytochrome c oxidase assembly protein subunit 11